MRKRIGTLTLLFAILLTQIGCNSQAEPQGETSNTDSQETSKSETQSRVDDLPDDLDFGGETVNFLYRNEIVNEFYVEEDTGDIVDTAIYNSIKNVEDRLNVTINVTSRDGNMASARAEYNDHIVNSILAGDNEYDWCDMLAAHAPSRISQGLFADLCEVDYIDIDKPYYLQGFEDMKIDGKLYMISGDASLGYLKNSFVIYFNTEVAENYKIENLYELVESGKWTLDKLAEIAQIASEDLNGDGNYDENDKIGFLVHNYNHLVGFYGSTNTHMYDRNSDGTFDFTFGSERDSSVCEKLFQTLYNTPGVYDCNLSDTTESEVQPFNELTNKFISGDILMMSAQMDESILYLRDMKSDYSVLPYPKYDEEQEDYITLSRSQHNAFVMPITCDSRDMAGAVMEALASEKYTNVLPAYFETALKVKYSRDDNTGRMLDIIQNSLSVQFEYVFSQAIGDPVLKIFRRCYSTENAFASTLASNKESLQTQIDDFIEKTIDNNTK